MPERGTYCPVTALYYASGITASDSLHTLRMGDGLNTLRKAMGEGFVTAYNANHTTEEVLAAFDKAIASLK